MATNLAQEWLNEREPSDIREAAMRMLRGECVAQTDNRFVDASPEDLAIEWLRDSSLESDYREAILGACKEMLAQCHAALVTGEELRDSTAFIRLCRVVDVAAPQELYGAVTALLTLVLRTPNVPPSVVTAAVRAGMAYRLTREDMPLWEDVAGRAETAAYGINALLRIAPDSECIPKLLVKLWIHQLADGWNVDVPFLVRMAARKTGDRQLPYVVTEAVQKAIVTHSRSSQLKNRLAEDLAQQQWSRGWNSSFATLSGLNKGPAGNLAGFQAARTCNHTIRKSVAAELDRRGIDVRISVQNGVVTLSGEVKSAEQYRAAQCLAMGVTRVKKVVNQISVVHNRIRSRKARTRIPSVRRTARKPTPCAFGVLSTELPHKASLGRVNDLRIQEGKIRFAMGKALAGVLSPGFSGTAALEVTVHGGTIQSIRTRFRAFAEDHNEMGNVAANI